MCNVPILGFALLCDAERKGAFADEGMVSGLLSCGSLLFVGVALLESVSSTPQLIRMMSLVVAAGSCSTARAIDVRGPHNDGWTKCREAVGLIRIIAVFDVSLEAPPPGWPTPRSNEGLDCTEEKADGRILEMSKGRSLSAVPSSSSLCCQNS